MQLYEIENKRIGAAIRRKRLREGLSLRDLADKVDLTHKTIAKIERGEVDRPRPATLKMIAEALHTTHDDLVKKAMGDPSLYSVEHAGELPNPLIYADWIASLVDRAGGAPTVEVTVEELVTHFVTLMKENVTLKNEISARNLERLSAMISGQP